ncbi:MAG: PRD domain-containing protein [Thermosediminibacteraceae bacterium]|nr:PRD domain-containing protein [Thermosediminibacteraceae bacterium]
MVIPVEFTRREKEILKILLEEPTTAERLASILKVSRRTILRDLPGLSEKLKPLGITLVRKSGIGISLEGGRESIENLRWLVGQPSGNVDITPDERQKLIILFLVENKGPQKLYNFAKEFGVTEATISNDLDKIEGILSQYGIKLIRRPGLGVWIEGPEKNIRHLVTDLFYEYFDEVQMVRLIKENLRDGKIPGGDLKDNIKNRLFGFIERNLLEGIEYALKEAVGQSGINLADSAYAGLLVHIALALERLKSGEIISMDKSLLATLKKTKEFDLARKLGAKLESTFGISIPEGELGYITMHLLGAKLRMGNDLDELFAMNHLEAREAAIEILKEAGGELKRNLLKDAQVLEDLALHLKPAMVRMRLGMEIRNPILSQIKETYPQLMQVAKRAARLLERRFAVQVPEAEIGYIAMHIGAALERERSRERTGVVLVCPSGIGSARMLASRIRKELPELEIIDVVSLLDLEKSLVQHPETEAIISTVPLEGVKLPVLLVSPLLTPEDIENIRAHFKERRLKETDSRNGMVEQEKFRGRQELAFELLEDFWIEEINAQNLEELLDVIEDKIKSKPGVISASQVKEDIYTREMKAGTAVPGLGIAVLHARTSGVEKPFLALFRLQQPLKMKNMDAGIEDVRACLLMLLPPKSSAEEVEIMGRISAALVEDKNLAKVFNDGESIDVIKSLLRILK